MRAELVDACRLAAASCTRFPPNQRYLILSLSHTSLPAPWTVKVSGRARGQIASPLDGRFGVLDTEALDRAISFMVEKTDLRDVDFVVGIPEGGLIPAYAFARKAGIPMLFATRFQPAEGQFITFQEEHDGVTAGRHISGLAAGQRIVIVEDEISTGRTVVNCVRAIRDAGVTCSSVATIYVADRIETRELLDQNDVSLVAAALFSPDVLTDLYR